MNFPNTTGRILSNGVCDGWGVLSSTNTGTWSRSATFPSANRAYYYPLTLFEDFLVTTCYTATGSAATGSIDIGAYTLPGLKRVFSTGSTSMGASTDKLITITLASPAILTRGNYLMAFACNSASSVIPRYSSGSTVGMLFARIMQEDVYPLAATATPVALTNDYFPLFSFAGP